MNIQIVGDLEFKILNKKGEIERLFKKPMNSLLRNFIANIYNQWAAAPTDFYDYTNTLRTLGSSLSFNALGPTTNNLYGVLVGTGTNPVAITNYNLQTKIVHGGAAGQLYHQATTITIPAVSGPECYINISRNFNNNSGATITVQEVALILLNISTSYYFLVARDLTGAIDVLNGKTLATLYTLRVSA
jgi:hypothetical protein